MGYLKVCNIPVERKKFHIRGIYATKNMVTILRER